MSSIAEVSFCVPAFNASARIERCLRGVLAQKVPSREILVVDNCSTDDTVAKARKMLHKIPGARIVINPRNLGRVENWNRCLELATGRFIKFAFTNDVLLPGGLQMLLRQIRRRPQVVMVCSRPHKAATISEIPDAVPSFSPPRTFDAGATLSQFCSYGNNTGSLGAMLIRNDPVRRFGLRFRPDIPYWADHYFSIELAGCGRAVYSKAVTYLFDASVKDRYARAKISNRAYYFEGRECALLLAKLLPRHGLESWRGFDYLHQRYARACYVARRPPLSHRDTLRVFKDAGPYLPSVLKYRLLDLSYPRDRAFIKGAVDAGLYRFRLRS
jgi:glycosyltransferase involved in cell wall biosynthesis